MRRLCIAAALLVVAAAIPWTGSAVHAIPPPFGTPLQTAVFDPTVFGNAPETSTAFAHVSAAGAGYVRLLVNLDSIAPGGTTKPASFNPADPSDPAYQWGSIDDQVQKAVAAGLTPILCVYGMPVWGRDQTQPPTARPSSTWYGQFARGIALRYGGSFSGLPRVKYWQAWNEPNLGPNLEPERVGDALASPDWYRRMVNAFASAVKTVHTDNLVIAGGLAPYAATTGDGIPPLTFMKQFLCLSTMQVRPRPHCVERADFDIWAMQPYTWGGPTHASDIEGDVMLGNLPSMKAALDQAVAQGRIVSDQPVQFWVTEFSWDTNPPDPGGVPMELQTRWTAQALYVMWQNGVSLVTWFAIRDQLPPSRWQSGLYFNNGSIATDTPKETFYAFRFPTVGFVQAGGIKLWCRTPYGAPGTILFQQDVTGTGSNWQTIATVPTDAYGIATTIVPGFGPQGFVRAIFANTGEASVAFSLTDVPDTYYDPFGA